MKVFFLAVLTSLLLTAVGWLSTRSTLFKLSSFQIMTDSDHLTRILQAKLAGRLGESMFSVSVRDFEEMLEVNPEVLEVNAKKRWPNTLQIVAKLRRPFFRLEGDLINTARDQRAMSFDLSREFLDLPVLKGRPDAQVLKKVAAFLSAYLSKEDLKRLRRLEWNSGFGLRLFFEDVSPWVDLGFDQFGQAWEKAKYFLETANGSLALKDVKSLDAAYNQRVIVSFHDKLKISENSLNLREIVRRRAKQ